MTELYLLFLIPMVCLFIIWSTNTSKDIKEKLVKWKKGVVDNKDYNWLVLIDNDDKGNEYALEFHYGPEKHGINVQYKGPSFVSKGVVKRDGGGFQYYGRWN
jgi:hypothetical protein